MIKLSPDQLLTVIIMAFVLVIYLINTTIDNKELPDYDE